ncbi:hypothetical protein MOKP118_23550 [Mycobacterium avium subsp. hominissuis]
MASAASTVSGQPIPIRAAASQPVRSASYSSPCTTKRAANTSTQHSEATSNAYTARGTLRQPSPRPPAQLHA